VCADLKSAKRQLSHQSLFELSGSAPVKAACKILQADVGEIDPESPNGILFLWAANFYSLRTTALNISA